MTDIDLINEFIERKNLNTENILGIVFYGSSCYKTATKHSDIDLLIITNSSNSYKGKIYLHGKKIEYFREFINFEILKTHKPLKNGYFSVKF